ENIRFTSSQNFYEDGLFAYKVYARAKYVRALPDTFYEYNIENPDSSCSKMTEKDRLIAILNTIKETLADWQSINIYDENITDFVDHILLYASLVCPNVIDGNYTKEITNAFGFDISGAENNTKYKPQTQELIKRLTKN
ncbi:MAG TPA: hypothetical protein PK737_03180, partial [Bacilli bacterium]|nr:hypothetical protein [Bacilli bacterium]